jgi:hypothetical protein
MLEAVSLSPIEFTATTAFLGQRLGSFTYCNNGFTSRRAGNFIYDSVGSSSQRIGNHTYYNDGSSSYRNGYFTYLVKARGAIGSFIKCIATELVPGISSRV